jgi:hypothetical protein
MAVDLGRPPSLRRGNQALSIGRPTLAERGYIVVRQDRMKQGRWIARCEMMTGPHLVGHNASEIGGVPMSNPGRIETDPRQILKSFPKILGDRSAIRRRHRHPIVRRRKGEK